MRTTWSSETTKAVDYTVARCLFRCHRYKTNYIKEVTPCCQTRTPKTPISFLLLICMEYDDSIVRQMVECIKVYPGGKLEIIFGGGYLVEESV